MHKQCFWCVYQELGAVSEKSSAVRMAEAVYR